MLRNFRVFQALMLWAGQSSHSYMQANCLFRKSPTSVKAEEETVATIGMIFRLGHDSVAGEVPVLAVKIKIGEYLTGYYCNGHSPTVSSIAICNSMVRASAATMP